MNRFFLLPLGILLLAPGARAQSVTIPLPPPTPLGGTGVTSDGNTTTSTSSSPVAMLAKPLAQYSEAELKTMGATGIAFPYELLDGYLHRYVNKRGNVYYLKAKDDNDLAVFARVVAVTDLDKFPVFSLPVDPTDASKGTAPDRSAELTFWINAYNGLRLKAIADLYPNVFNTTLKQLDTAKNQTVAGRTYSFVELRQKIGGMDPRALFALMKGNDDGPSAPIAVYRYSGLGEQLNLAVRTFINDPSRVSPPDRLANSVEVSPFLAEVDPFFKPAGSRRKNAGIRQLLSTYTRSGSARGYFTTGEYAVNFSLANSKLNDQVNHG